MSDKKNETDKDIKILIICWLAWSCLFVVLAICMIIYFALLKPYGLFQRSTDAAWQIFTFIFLFPGFGLIMGLTLYNQLLSKGIQPQKPSDEGTSKWIKFKEALNRPAFILIFSIYFFGMELIAGTIGLFTDGDGMLRLSKLIAGLYSIGSIGLTVTASVLIRLLNSEDKRQILRQKKEAELNENFCEQCLTVTGMRFFIKYYDNLKSWNLSDILDIIEEEYREEDKRERIKTAKKIFQRNMEQVALKIISESPKIDDDTKNNAKNLLETLLLTTKP